MAKLLDKITVVDIEATCWNGNPPEGMISDIIEIGICLLDVKTGEISDSRGILVKPERSTISEFCTELTTITPELIQQEGISYKEACAVVRKEYLAQSRAWASFGAYDLKHFQRQSAELGVGFPFGPSHINVKTPVCTEKAAGTGNRNGWRFENAEHTARRHSSPRCR